MTFLGALGGVEWPWKASCALGCLREVREALGGLGAWEELGDLGKL